jgi:CRISPR/Cas system-associated endonuclease Cas1
MGNSKMDDGDKRAWDHAIASGRLSMLDDAEVERLALVLVYTRTAKDGEESVPEADIDALLDWAQGVRVASGLLDALLSGGAYVRMKAGQGEPTFSLTPRGEEEAKDVARRMGLPVADDE